MVGLETLNSVDRHMNMAQFDQNNQLNKPFSDCDQSRLAFVDLIILIIVIGACGFLIHPLLLETFKTLEQVVLWFMVKQGTISGPTVYGLLGLGVLTAGITLLAFKLCKSQRCGRPGCQGMRKEVEFDIKVETEDCIKSSDSIKCGLKKGLYELPRDYYKELEAELKKLAPANGRVVLVFRGRCGCPVVQVEVPGIKKNNRKMKK